ncbi:hypothetical protein [uncultured Endozoicomonas sp.]|uniref:hypothetical protein n=1 Tax=uncultured Endozoicomonas sp. TaxID=432652 RepID=UPI002626DD1A|nr:hypothetical protein [uncultured Endozoicomonas sp.]
MGSKTVVALLVAVLMVGVAGWLLFSGSEEVQELPLSEVISVEDDGEVSDLEGEKNFPELEFDELTDETRIILVEPEEDELTNLLSEKVIRNDQIVDKTSKVNE